MATAPELMTVEEFERLPGHLDSREELVGGYVVSSPLLTAQQGRVAVQIGFSLHDFIERSGLGTVTGSGGYLLAEEPDLVRAPDTAWLSSDRRQRDSDRLTGYFKGAPNLAVEVVSEDDRDSDIADKVGDYLRYGTDRVWVARPRQRTVTFFAPGGAVHVYSEAETLTSEDAGFPVAGFELSVAHIFE